MNNATGTITEQDIAQLKRFIKRAEKLLTSNFWKWLTRPRGGPDMARIFAGDWLAHDGLEEDQFYSFCMSLRFFIQDTDGVSIRSIKRITDRWPNEHQDLQFRVREAVTHLNVRLEEKSLVSIHEGSTTTNRQLFDVLFYSGIAHENVGKRDEFDRLVQAGLFSFFVFQAFTSTLFHYRNCIRSVGLQVECYLEREGAVVIGSRSL